jgi:hypothetical protein
MLNLTCLTHKSGLLLVVQKKQQLAPYAAKERVAGYSGYKIECRSLSYLITQPIILLLASAGSLDKLTV